MAESLLSSKRRLFDDSVIKRIERDGTEIEKGVILTEDYLIKNEKFFSSILNIFAAYPDIYLDMIKPADSNFNLFFYHKKRGNECYLIIF